MPKILSKSGDSLADVYDVAGSIAGLENLESNDVNLVHEMGGVIFAERLTGSVTTMPVAAVAQNLAFGETFAFGGQPSRILGLQVFVNQAVTHLDDVSINIQGPAVVTEIPIWMWEVADGGINVRFILAGSTSENNFLVPPSNRILLPNLLLGSNAPQASTTLAIRGNTSGFGAGTVEITGIVYLAFAELGGVSSRGLPLPSW